jgi:hypothetical protein
MKFIRTAIAVRGFDWIFLQESTIVFIIYLFK